LSAYLEQVKNGEELIIKDRNRPVARLVPLTAGGYLDVEEMGLAAAGLIRLPTKSLPDSFWQMPAPRVSLTEAVSAVTSERDES
jgi:antitoxin (DNA-binding transcriptional repressor) of toxin-antitoxin stability system